MRILLAIALIVAGHGAAQACKNKGKKIYKIEWAPLPDYEDNHPNAQLHLNASGKWGRVQEMPNGQEPSSNGGCIKPKYLKEVTRALKKAKFKNGAPEMCDAVSETSVTYSAGKRSVTITSPCGATLDASTQRLVDCVDAAMDGSPLRELRAICRGTK